MLSRLLKRPQRERAQGLARLLFILLVAAAPAGNIGDRLVVAINGVPYSQRQIEIYIHVKETLRKSTDDSVRLISAGNWGDAITVFTEDMVILQESQRLGSFQAPDQAIDKYLGVVRDKLAKSAVLKQTLDRLGGTEPIVGHALEDVLRIAAFRRSKDHEDAQTKKTPGTDRTRAKWLDDLQARSVARLFKDSEDYVVIEPTEQSAGGEH